MKVVRFFDTIENLHRYTLQLSHQHQETECSHCLAVNQWASHGFVYKKDYAGGRVTIGKRILCSNKGLKMGCGRTVQLYLAQRIPRLHYSISILFAFALATCVLPICRAYHQATGACSARNAYRWLCKLVSHTARHRTYVMQPVQSTQHQNHRATVFVETITAIVGNFGSGESYQLQVQEPFFT